MARLVTTDVDLGRPDSEPDVQVLLRELLYAVAQGRTDAFTKLYELTSPKVFAVAASVVRDVNQSEDVTQEVYLQIWQRAALFDPERGSALAWVLTIARRRAIDRVRSSQSHKVRDTSYSNEAHEPEFDSVVDGVLRSEDERLLRVALAQLTPIQQEAIVLVYFHGRTHVEASELLGVPLGTLKGRVREGLSSLRGLTA